MAIKDGDTIQSDDLLNNMIGKQFKNYAQTIFNADYIGWNSKLNYDEEGASGGTPEFTNLHWDNFNGNGIGVESHYGLELDSTNKVYYTPDLSGVTEYIIIEATSLSGIWNSNDCKTLQIASGKWLVYCTSGTDAVHRAQIHKSLWYGTNGSDALIDDFTSVTSVQTSNADDVDKRALYVTSTAGAGDGTTTHTFNDTTDNNDCSSWSLCGATGSNTVTWEIPEGTARNSQSGGAGTSNELGTDTSGDEVDNPSDCQIEHSGGGLNTYAYVIILCYGSISTTTGGTTPSHSEIDYYADNSIPLMTAADTLANEGATTGTLISNDTATAVTNGIAIWNSAIDATNTEAFYLSADDGANWEEATEKTIKRLSNSGSNFKIKWEVTRTDTSKKDTISAFAVLYNIGAE